MPRKKKEEVIAEETEVKESKVKKVATKKEPTKKTTSKKKSESSSLVEPKKEAPKTVSSKKSTKATTIKKSDEEKKEVKSKKSSTKKVKSTSSEDAKKTSKAKKETVSSIVPTKKTKTATEKKATTSKTSKDLKTSKSKTSDEKKTKKTTTSKIAKKSTSSKTTKKSTISKTKNTKKIIPTIEVLEYYDLPYRYNQTVVKVLYQTPTTLFIYWDISDSDRENYIKQYGDNFFNDTKPVLVVYNDTMHYSFELEINDFANSWYLHVNDSNCKYRVELGRRPRYYNGEKYVFIPNDYLYVSNSNEIESPNDHVLFDKNIRTVYFKDVKTNIVTAESITSLSFMRNMGRIYSLYDLYTDFNNVIYRWQLDLRNPSSANPTSTFK